MIYGGWNTGDREGLRRWFYSFEIRKGMEQEMME